MERAADERQLDEERQAAAAAAAASFKWNRLIGYRLKLKYCTFKTQKCKHGRGSRDAREP
jgi:hypothetical protein